MPRLSQTETANLESLPSPTVLGGSWVVRSRVISRVTLTITHIRGLIAPLITTPEPPSRSLVYGPLL